MSSKLILLGSLVFLATATYSVAAHARSSHDPILIDQYCDLDSGDGITGWKYKPAGTCINSPFVTGSGSSGSPYVISGYNIDADDGDGNYGIKITYAPSSYYVVLKDLAIRDSNVAGIYIDDVDTYNIRIGDSNLAANAVYTYLGSHGVYIYSTNSVAIENLITYSNVNHGIYMNLANYTSVDDTWVWNNGGNGIYMYNSDRCGVGAVEGNTVNANNDTYSYGVYYRNASDYGSVENNDIYDNYYGVRIRQGSDYHNIEHNDIYQNASLGIHFRDLANGNSAHYNDIADNTSYGIYVGKDGSDEPTSSRIYWNDFTGNGGATHQGFDNTAAVKDNDWYYDTTSCGNHWDDWDTPGTCGDTEAGCFNLAQCENAYLLDGGVSRYDSYPFAEQVTDGND